MADSCMALCKSSTACAKAYNNCCQHYTQGLVSIPLTMIPSVQLCADEKLAAESMASSIVSSV